MGGIIGAGASIFGGISAANAAQTAAAQQAQEYGQALGFQQQVYGNSQTNLQPWIGGGQQALTSLLGFYGLPGGNASGATQAFQQFQNTPTYQFGLNQGMLGVNRQLASSGLIGSGAALKDAVGYNQGYASQQLGSYLQGLSGISGGGLQAGAALGGLSNTAAGTMLQGYTGLGNAQGAGTIGANNALNQGIGNSLPYLFGTPGTGNTSYGGGAGGAGSQGGYGGGVIGSALNSFFGGGGGGNNGYVDSGTWGS